MCLEERTHRREREGRVTKKGEVTMPKACWDGARGAGLAEEGKEAVGGVFMRPVRVKQNKKADSAPPSLGFANQFPRLDS